MFYGRQHDLFDFNRISVSQMTTGMSRLSQALPGSFLNHDFTGFLSRLTKRVPLMQQELITLPEFTPSPPGFRGVRATRSLVSCVCFVIVVCPFIFFFWPLCCLSFDLRIIIAFFNYIVFEVVVQAIYRHNTGLHICFRLETPYVSS